MLLFQGGIWRVSRTGRRRLIIGTVRLIIGSIRPVRCNSCRLTHRVGRLLLWLRRLLLRILICGAIILLWLVVRRCGWRISWIGLGLRRASGLGLRGRRNPDRLLRRLLNLRQCLWLLPRLSMLWLWRALNLLLFLYLHLVNFSACQRFATIGLNGFLLLNERHGRRRRCNFCHHRAVYDGLRRFDRGSHGGAENRFSRRRNRRSGDTHGCSSDLPLIHLNNIPGDRLCRNEGLRSGGGDRTRDSLVHVLDVGHIYVGAVIGVVDDGGVVIVVDHGVGHSGV